MGDIFQNDNCKKEKKEEKKEKEKRKKKEKKKNFCFVLG